MDSKQKKQIISLAQIIYEALAELRKLLEKHQYEAGINLLADCQEGAISIGNVIEANEGEGQVIVSSIEEFCEMLYSASITLEVNHNPYQICKRLQKKILHIQTEIKKQIKAVYEIVFLPYKATMWDSLESIWRAADEDGECNVSVVPVPYYDKNPDGSFGKMRYEGYVFPHDVPVTSYLSYNIQEKRPDAIFICNPYDEFNYVTSVHPQFYSYELKKCTDMLVYIPYFVSGGDVAEGQCITSAVFHSDRVIVESEKVRETYLRVLKKHLAVMEESEEEQYLQNKIIALGSPKIDKVINTRREDIILPNEWTEKIYGKDNI